MMADISSENTIHAGDSEGDSAVRRTSRRVARLSSQQVQHKRNLDRTSQQAYRQRIKSRVKDLEDELARLKADRGSSQETLLHKIQTLHAENRDLKGRLKSIQKLAVADESHAGDDFQYEDLHSSALTGDVGGNATPVQHEIPVRSPDDQQMATSEQNYEPDIQIDLAHQGQPRSSAFTNSNVHSDAYIHNDDTNAHVEPSTSQPNVLRNADMQPSLHSSINAHQEDYVDHDPPQGLLGNINVSESPPNGMLYSPSNVPILPPSIEQAMPRHVPGIYPIEIIFLDFLSSRRALVARGLPMNSVLGPDRLLVQGFVDSENIPALAVHPICQTLTEILLTFGDVALPEKLAFMFVMFRNMRWQLSSSKNDYEAMPRWLRPTALQITAAHSAWIDNLPWPHMRDLLIEDPQKYPYSTFSRLYSPNVSVNWPYDPMDAVTMVGNDMVLNPIFEKHIQRLENWKVSGLFCESLPELAAATCR